MWRRTHPRSLETRIGLGLPHPAPRCHRRVQGALASPMEASYPCAGDYRQAFRLGWSCRVETWRVVTGRRKPLREGGAPGEELLGPCRVSTDVLFLGSYPHWDGQPTDVPSGLSDTAPMAAMQWP